MGEEVYLPELCFFEGQVREGLGISVVDGTIAGVTTNPPSGAVQLPGLLLPALANAHSHAFQRALRGRTQHTNIAEPADDFWSWREAMYAVATSVSPDGIYDIARQAFLDMLRSGFTAVGEFHYLQHQPDGTPYADTSELALAVIRAARDVGIRIALLRVCYARAGYQQEMNPRQRRFIDGSIDECLSRTERLISTTESLDDDGVSVGIAPHSVRAVPLSWLKEISAWAKTRELPVHMHLSEQKKELEQCLAEHGTTPLTVLTRNTDLVNSRFTAVHGTHFTPAEVARISKEGASICACPATERDLGDGFLPATDIHRFGARLCLGTDSHCQIDGFAEMRLIEYHERLRREKRNILVDQQGDVAQWLFTTGTRRGFDALGLEGGTLAVGQPFDAFTVRTGHPALIGCPANRVLAAVVFAGVPDMVRDVWVGGRHVLVDGEHPDQIDISRRYVSRLETLFSA